MNAILIDKDFEVVEDLYDATYAVWEDGIIEIFDWDKDESAYPEISIDAARKLLSMYDEEFGK